MPRLSTSGPHRTAARRASAPWLIPGLIAALLISSVALGGCGDSNSSASSKNCYRVIEEGGKKTNKCFPVAARTKRVDLVNPTFSNSTSVTNPLHPTSKITQTIYGGQVDGKPFRTEVTLLPGTKTIEWNGKQVKNIIIQYFALSDGRIQESTLDWYAQADDGSVWYFGEDVTDYEDGVAVTHEGTWLAGKDGAPAAMIMPANPKVGNVYRTENAYPVVFEEVTVKKVNQTVAGPSGPVTGAMTVSELHMDGTREDKTFAPGYGEFSTGNPKGDLEAASLALPTDAKPGPRPAHLTALSAAVRGMFEKVGRNDWDAAKAAMPALRQTWDAHRAGGMSELLDKQMSRDINSLSSATDRRKPAEAHQAALRVAQNDLDLQSLYQPVPVTDQLRMELWSRQLGVDLGDSALGAARGDIVSLTWTWERIKHLVNESKASQVDSQLRSLQAAADQGDNGAISRAAPELATAIAAAKP